MDIVLFSFVYVKTYRSKKSSNELHYQSDQSAYVLLIMIMMNCFGGMFLSGPL